MSVQVTHDKTPGANGILGNLFTRAVGSFEHACAAHAGFARWYEKSFYRDVVEREESMAELPQQAHVLHIGAGRYPFTALILARKGHKVMGIDHDADAVESARRIVRAEGLDSCVKILHRDGTDVDCRDYDAVWVSFHVHPRDVILERCSQTLSEGSTLIARIPSGLGRLAYGSCKADIGEGCRCDSFKSVLVVKGGAADAEALAPFTLDRVPIDQEVHVVEGNGHPHLEPLGIRAGKPVRVCARMPVGGAVLVDIDGRKVALGTEIARCVRCRRSMAVD